MKKTFFTLLASLLFGGIVMSATPTAYIAKAKTAPVIDGTIDDVWSDAGINIIETPYNGESPTLGDAGSTTWRALWDDNGIYILLEVNDDVFAPIYMGAGDEYRFDKVEIYFDVNAVLADGKGPGNTKGHYQVAPGFEEYFTTGEERDLGSGKKWATVVSDPTYVSEYFVPFSTLIDSKGAVVEKNTVMGFDVYVVDNDVLWEAPVRNRAVWSNVGTKNESYSNMDDCGTIQLIGATAGVKVASVTVEGNKTITEDNAQLQLTATVAPANATLKEVKWEVVNGTGKAIIDQNGLLTPRSNGTVTAKATAKDGSSKSGSLEITISGQVTQPGELSVLLDGTFEVDGAWGSGTTTGGTWGAGGSNATYEIVGGVAKAMIEPVANPWDCQIKNVDFVVANEKKYFLVFDAWADLPTTINYDFEDMSNNYNRYGASEDEDSNGRCEWNTAIGTTSETYVRSVTFDQVVESTSHSFVWQLGSTTSREIYLDNVFLYEEGDYTVSTPSISSKTKITVYPNPVVNCVNISTSLKDFKVAIYNNFGQKVAEGKANGNAASFDVSAFPKGIYFVKLEDGASMKFVK